LSVSTPCSGGGDDADGALCPSGAGQPGDRPLRP
jgi:hypothetical protein